MGSEAPDSSVLKLRARRTCACHVSLRISIGGRSLGINMPLQEFSQLLDLARTVANGTSPQAVMLMDLVKEEQEPPLTRGADQN